MVELKSFTYEELNKLNLSVVRNIGREVGVKSPTAMRKDALIDAILGIQSGVSTPTPRTKKGAPPKESADLSAYMEKTKHKEYDFRPLRQKPQIITLRDSGKKGLTYTGGSLQILSNGDGYAKVNIIGESDKDIFVPKAVIETANAKDGDYVSLAVDKDENGVPFAVEIELINGSNIRMYANRVDFNSMKPLYPVKKIAIDGFDAGFRKDRVTVDVVAPIGFGQRVLVTSPRRAGRTTLFKDLTHGITREQVGEKTIVLLIGERPEEIAEYKDIDFCSVIATPFGASESLHEDAVLTVIKRAKNIIEANKHVIIICDSLNKIVKSQSDKEYGKTLARELFGLARNTDHGTSITVILGCDAPSNEEETALYEEFSSCANSEIVFSKELADAGIYPAIDGYASYTRRAETLMEEKIYNAYVKIKNEFSTYENPKEELARLVGTSSTVYVFVDKVDDVLAGKDYGKK